MVMVVEVFARFGIFSRLLLTMMKNNLAAKAKPAPRMKCQSKIILTIPSGVKLEPLIKDLDPVSRIEMTVTIENKIV